MSESRPELFRIRPDKSPFRSLNRLILVGIVVALIFVGIGIFRPVVARLQAIQDEVNELSIKIDNERARLEQHQREIELVKNDPEYLELVARDLRPLMKPEETIYQIREPRPLQPAGP